MKKQAEFKAELIAVLNSVYAKIVGEDDDVFETIPAPKNQKAR